MLDETTQPVPNAEQLRKHFEEHHAREKVRDPETGELVNSPADFAANKKPRPVPTEQATPREE